MRFGGPYGDGCEGVAIDGLGNVLVTGFFTGSAELGGATLIGGGQQDVVIAKLAP